MPNIVFYIKRLKTINCDQNDRMAVAKVDKKEIAKYYYIKGEFSQAEIAQKVGSSEQTIVRWKKLYKWDDLKKSMLTTRPEQLANLYDQLSELNERIKQRPPGERYAQNKEADILTKLTAAIRSLEIEVSLADTIDVFMEFNNWMRDADLEKAKELIAYQDAYIKTLL